MALLRPPGDHRRRHRRRPRRPPTSTFDPAQGGNTVNWHYDGPDAYADPAFDQQHAAYWGQRLGASWMREPIGDLAAAAQPNIIVSNLGINDLSDGTAVALIDGYRQWVADARAVTPTSTSSSARSPRVGLRRRPAEFNALIDDLAAELTTVGSRVEVFRVEASRGRHVGRHPRQRVGRAEVRPRRHRGPRSPRVASAAVPDPVVPVVQEPVPGVPAEPQVTAPLPRRPGRSGGSPSARVGAEGRRPGVVRWRASASAESYRVRCGRREVKTSGRRLGSGAGRPRARSVRSTTRVRRRG